MKPAEAIAFADHVDERFRMSDEREELAALRLLLRFVPQHVRKTALSAALAQAEAFRRSDQPGHEVHYPLHVRTAAAAVRVYGESP